MEEKDIEIITDEEQIEEASNEPEKSEEDMLELLKEKRKVMAQLHAERQNEIIKRKQKFYLFEETEENKQHAINCEGIVDELLEAKQGIKNEKKQRKAIMDAFKKISFNGVNLYENTEQQYKLGLVEKQMHLFNKEGNSAKVDFMSPIQGKKLMLVVVGNIFHLADFKADKQVSFHVSF